MAPIQTRDIGSTTLSVKDVPALRVNGVFPSLGIECNAWGHQPGWLMTIYARSMDDLRCGHAHKHKLITDNAILQKNYYQRMYNRGDEEMLLVYLM